MQDPRNGMVVFDEENYEKSVTSVFCPAHTIIIPQQEDFNLLANNSNLFNEKGYLLQLLLSTEKAVFYNDQGEILHQHGFSETLEEMQNEHLEITCQVQSVNKVYPEFTA